MAENDDEVKRLADVATIGLSLVELRLVRLSAELVLPTPELDLTPNYSVPPTRMLVHEEDVVYAISYRVSAMDARERETVRATITFSMVFKKLDRTLTEDHCAAFGAIGVPSVAHPYVREILHNLTTRMGLPPLLMDVMPPVLNTEMPLSTRSGVADQEKAT